MIPGVGAFGDGMENAGPFRERLVDAAADGTPILGICLGMQMLLTSSEEADHAGQGEVRGLDLVPGRNVRFRGDRKVPHMGWNELSVERDHPLVTGVEVDDGASEARRDDGAASGAQGTEDAAAGGPVDGGSVDGGYAYFVHSYYAEPEEPNAVVATTDYGVEFPAIVADESGNVMGTQFHPEKSGETGLRLLRNFVDICASR
ncbi:imidazole glycerol phosphate synthase subunit HisH [Halobium palmae]|uniref:Imidazole glycerol phosphate synthase subunit HisH n=1 Tax=Halobium palmae TaxID=1776492 RepID=A0ABD5S3I5_9EURY